MNGYKANSKKGHRMTMKMDDLVKAYVTTREKLSQLKVKHDAELAPYKELQDKIEAELLARFNQMGVESVRTNEGTAYTTVRARAGIADWDMFLQFVKNNEAFEMIERRVSKTAVEQYKAVHDDELPPGINWSEERVVNIRRS